MTEEQRQARIRHHMYESCEGITEHVERIVSLEELVEDVWAFIDMSCRECDEWVQLSSNVGTCRLGWCKHKRDLMDRTRELGIEVDE